MIYPRLPISTSRLSDQADSSLNIPLSQYRDHLLHQKSRWVTPMASSIRFNAHVERSQMKPLWIYEPRSSSSRIQPNPAVIITPSDDNLDIESSDSDVEDLPGALHEPDDILLTEELQTLDDAEDGNAETSVIFYMDDDLSLIWEPPVRNHQLHVTIYSYQFVGCSRRSPLVRLPALPRSSSVYWLKICQSQIWDRLV